MPSSLLRRLSAAVALCLFAGLAVHAAGPTFWQISTEAELLRGEVDNLSIDSYGRLTLGPSTAEVYASTAPFLWTMVQGPDGGSYIGSGNEGQVLRVDAAGAGRVFFDADELEVHALAFAPDGNLYVGTSPDGKIYKVTPAGTGTVFFDPPDRYIWSLAIDRAGNVIAGTGDKGVVYRITPDGRGAPLYQTKATHAMSLAIDGQGRVLVGTESPARVFQIDATGRPFVVLDTPYTEIHALRVDGRGNVWVAAVGGRAGGGGTPAPAAVSAEPASGGGQPIVTVSTEFSAVVIADAGAQASGAAPARAAGTSTGAIYRIGPDGASDLVWDLRDDSPYDIAFDSDATVVVATGNRGKIYRLAGDPLQPTLIARTTSQQVTAMARDRSGQTLFATSNPGRLFRLSATRADRGTYTSDVRDAQNVATWGTIRWQALTANGSRVELSTRSGNTRTPDDTWSDWSAPYATSDGTQITSPRARYLQWRAVLVGGRGDAPLLTSVVAAYLPRNSRPKVTSITINPPGTVYQRPFPTGDPDIQGFQGEPLDRRFAAQTAGTTLGGTPNLGRRAYQKGLLTFVWRADDDNRDDLVYSVLYRREGDTTWRPLKADLNEAILAWDTTSVPNGRYILRVVASDSPSNAPSTTLTGSLDSATFDIDNTPPAIVVTNSRRDGTRVIVSFEVRDQDSAVQRVEYSADGDTWQMLYPTDGIADSRLERFELTLDGETATRGVTIRATDALNNIGSGRGDPPPASGGR
ncbi:MAG: hypothetical protein ABL986_22850 [Vicinamibacterales bacterium]